MMSFSARSTTRSKASWRVFCLNCAFFFFVSFRARHVRTCIVVCVVAVVGAKCVRDERASERVRGGGDARASANAQRRAEHSENSDRINENASNKKKCSHALRLSLSSSQFVRSTHKLRLSLFHCPAHTQPTARTNNIRLQHTFFFLQSIAIFTLVHINWATRCLASIFVHKHKIGACVHT